LPIVNICPICKYPDIELDHYVDKSELETLYYYNCKICDSKFKVIVKIVIEGKEVKIDED